VKLKQQAINETPPTPCKAVAAIAPFNPVITTAPLLKTPSGDCKALSYYQYFKITIDNISSLQLFRSYHWQQCL
jgi:hypothetical protein